MNHSRIIAASVASLAGAILIAQPAHADHRHHSHTGTGTGTLVFTGDPARVIEKRNGTEVLIDIPVAGTIDVTGRSVEIHGTFTGTDTLKSNDTRSKVRGTRSYELNGFGTCTGDDKGSGPNEFGGVDFVETLRCTDGSTIRLEVQDVSLLPSDIGFNRTITAKVTD